MKRFLLILLFALSLSLFGENKDLNNLKTYRAKAIKREEQKKIASLKNIKAEYLKKLQALMIKLTQKGDLDAALKVKAVITSVKSGY